jgi:phage-related protein
MIADLIICQSSKICCDGVVIPPRTVSDRFCQWELADERCPSVGGRRLNDLPIIEDMLR